MLKHYAFKTVICVKEREGEKSLLITKLFSRKTQRPGGTWDTGM